MCRWLMSIRVVPSLQAESPWTRLLAAPLPGGLRRSQPLSSPRAHSNLNFFSCC